MADSEGMGRTDELVAARIDQIRRQKRSRIRWGIGKHTAELAIRALADAKQRDVERKSSKSRRRKRTKRLL